MMRLRTVDLVRKVRQSSMVRLPSFPMVRFTRTVAGRLVAGSTRVLVRLKDRHIVRVMDVSRRLRCHISAPSAKTNTKIRGFEFGGACVKVNITQRIREFTIPVRYKLDTCSSIAMSL
jgi:hypothetical protein